MLPEIVIDVAKCPDPLSCRRCLMACPTEVLGLGTKVAPQKFREMERGDFVVEGVRYMHCTACGQCVSVCPSGAVSLKFDGGG